MPNPQPESPAQDSAGAPAAAPKNGGVLQVRFAQSKITAPWQDGSYESLLDLAEAWNIDISSGCRYGDCGTCLTQLLEGEVVYHHETGVEPDSGYCLPCSCRPLTSITLNA